MRNSLVNVKDSINTVRRKKEFNSNKLKSDANVEMEETAESEGDIEDKSENKVTSFPEIRGDKKIKDVKLAILDDLEANGLVKRNVPFSSARKLDFSKRPLATRITAE